MGRSSGKKLKNTAKTRAALLGNSPGKVVIKDETPEIIKILRNLQSQAAREIHRPKIPNSLNLSGITLKDIHLTGLNFNQTKMKGIKVENGSFGSHSNKTAATLIESDLSDSEFSGCNFRYSDLTGVGISGAIFKMCNFNNANLQNIDFSESSFLKSKFSFADLSGSDFCNSEFQKCFFKFTEFGRGIEIENTDFSESLFESIQFELSVLKDVSFKESMFKDQIFSGGRIEKANFENCEMRAGLLNSTNTESCVFRGASFKSTRIFNVSDLGSKFASANFSNLSVENSEFSGSDFSNASFKNIQFQKTKFKDCSLVNSVFDNISCESDDQLIFSASNLSGADFSKIKEGVSLRFESCDLFESTWPDGFDFSRVEFMDCSRAPQVS